MSEIKETVREPEQEAEMTEQTPEKPTGEAPLSPRRRTALVTYLAILFAAAFLFVAVVMVLETKHLKSMNEELKSDSQKTSASLTNNINALQEENQKLTAANEELTQRITGLEEAALRAEEEITGLQGQIETLNAEKQGWAEERAALEDQLTEKDQLTQDAVRVSELLHEALAADEEGDLERLQEILDQIEPLQDLLSPTERDIYEELKIA